MLESSHSEKNSEKDSPATESAPAKGRDKNSAQPVDKGDAKGPALSIAVTELRQNTLPLRFSSLFLPVLPPTAAPRPSSENVVATGVAPIEAKQISGRENAKSAAVEDSQPSNPEPVALPSVLAEDAPAAVTADQGSLAFAARLTSAVTPTQTSLSATQAAPDVPTRPKAGPASTSPQTFIGASANTVEEGSQPSRDTAKSVAQEFVKSDTSIPVTTPPQAFVSCSKAPVSIEVSRPVNEANVEAPPIATTSSHDIRVRVSDNQGGTLDVRFLDLGSEVRVSVRTPDNNLAQSLRGNLTELTQHLSVGGINSEMWGPGSGSSLFQGSSQQSPDSDSNSNQSGHGAHREAKQGNPQQQQKQNQPGWLQEFESSTAPIQPKGN